MNLKTLSPAEIDTLRDCSAELVGKRVVINQLRVPGTGAVSDIALETRGKVALAVSQVELFPQLIEGTKYYQRFHRDGAGTVLHREPYETFVFQGQGGNPAVSIVLPHQEDAIAVIKRLIAEDGTELTWSSALQRLGLDPASFRNFTNTADGIQTMDTNARFRLEEVPDVPATADDVREHPNEHVPNLNAIIKISQPKKRALRQILPALLQQEQ